VTEVNEVPTTMTTAIHLSDKPAIEYPDDDGEPMADNTVRFKWIVLIKENLEIVFRNEPNVFVAGNLLWYAVEGQPTIRMAPDALVVFGRPKGRRGSYKQWEEGGIAPHVVIETLSPGNTPPEMKRKLEFYERYGVEEYYIYDPDDGSLEAWLRAGTRLVKVDNVSGFVSPRLQIRFEPGEGPDNLTIFGPDGTRFLTSIEFKEQSESYRRQADEANRQAALNRNRAEESDRQAASERQRAEKLADQLRELGIDPDSA
jgi:Uma2 family endonuclease